jgi:hypothetical protein
MDPETVRIKHLEACKKWRDNNREKYRQVALNYVNRKREEDPEEFKQTMRERAKRNRLKNPEKLRTKSKIYARTMRETNPEKVNQRQREYRKNNPEKFKEYYQKHREKRLREARIGTLKKKYGLTLESYEEMLLKQEGKCAICESGFGDKKPNLPNIDHNHITGKVRGLLCSPCNIVLGYVEKRENTISDFYERFTEYLK